MEYQDKILILSWRQWHFLSDKSLFVGKQLVTRSADLDFKTNKN